MTIEKINPAEAAEPIGYYSHIAIVPPGYRLIVLAGQVGSAPDGSYPDCIEEQFEHALAAALALVASQRAGPDDVVKITYYLTERPTDFGRIRAAIREAFPNSPPAATYLIVSGLAQPQIKVEIEITAAVMA